MEETFDLRRVQIDHDGMVDSNGLQNIGDQPRHDRFPSTVPLVRSPVAEEWYDGRNTRGSGAAASIGQSKKLDQVIACRR